MPEYSYKEFVIQYDIKATDTGSYQAQAKLVCCADGKKYPVPQRFQTVSDSKPKVVQELKRLIKNYIDFEWKEFFKMKDEHQKAILHHQQG